MEGNIWILCLTTVLRHMYMHAHFLGCFYLINLLLQIITEKFPKEIVICTKYVCVRACVVLILEIINGNKVNI